MFAAFRPVEDAPLHRTNDLPFRNDFVSGPAGRYLTANRTFGKCKGNRPSLAAQLEYFHGGEGSVFHHTALPRTSRSIAA